MFNYKNIFLTVLAAFLFVFVINLESRSNRKTDRKIAVFEEIQQSRVITIQNDICEFPVYKILNKENFKNKIGQKGSKKTIGILGGMGPESTAYLFELIIKNTKANKDSDHIPVIIYSNPKIPSRTAAILGRGPSPIPLLVDGIRVLRQAGADFAVIACLAAHYFHEEIVKQENFPVLNIIEESSKWAKKNIQGLKKAGLLTTMGSLRSRIFHDSFKKRNIEIITPDEDEQMLLIDALSGEQGIKAGYTTGRPKEIIVDLAKKLIERGAEAIIVGCTEIPLVLKQEDVSVPLIEPLQIIARICILNSGYELK